MNIKIENIKQFDIFWECEQGLNECFVALENVKIKNEYASFKGKNVRTGKIVNFGQSLESNNIYTLKLYSTPQYVNKIFTLNNINYWSNKK